MSKLEILTQKVKVNLLSLVCSSLLLLSPFLPWINLVTMVIANGALLTGFAVQPSLLDIATQKAGISLGQTTLLSSLGSLAFLIVGGLVSLKKCKTGILIATFGLITFVLASYTLFGKEQNGAITAYTSVGIGLFVALIGIICGVFSMIHKRKPIGEVISHLGTKESLTKMGLLFSTIPTGLDGLNHASLGQMPAFFGSNYIEMTLHTGLLFSIASLFFIIIYGKKFHRVIPLQAIVMLPFFFLVSDASYHILNQGILHFLGVDSIEITLHFLTYYGIVSVIIGSLLVKR